MSHTASDQRFDHSIFFGQEAAGATIAATETKRGWFLRSWCPFIRGQSVARRNRTAGRVATGRVSVSAEASKQESEEESLTEQAYRAVQVSKPGVHYG